VTLKWKKDFLPEICTSSVEVYDPDSNSWSAGPSLANALCGAGQYMLSSYYTVISVSCFGWPCIRLFFNIRLRQTSCKLPDILLRVAAAILVKF